MTKKEYDERYKIGIEQLRAVVKAFGDVNESFVQRFSVSQLIRLHEAWLLCDWDFSPDTWTERQVKEAMRGTVPQWDTAEDGGSEPVYASRADIAKRFGARGKVGGTL